MEYVVAINRPKRGDIIPVIDVAEAMAKHASTAYGERTMHSPTLDAIRPQRVEMLMAAAKHGAIKVCSNDGAMGDAEALIQASPLPQFFSIEGVARVKFWLCMSRPNILLNGARQPETLSKW